MKANPDTQKVPRVFFHILLSWFIFILYFLPIRISLYAHVKALKYVCLCMCVYVHACVDGCAKVWTCLLCWGVVSRSCMIMSLTLLFAAGTVRTAAEYGGNCPRRTGAARGGM